MKVLHAFYGDVTFVTFVDFANYFYYLLLDKLLVLGSESWLFFCDHSAMIMGVLVFWRVVLRPLLGDIDYGRVVVKPLL